MANHYRNDFSTETPVNKIQFISQPIIHDDLYRYLYRYLLIGIDIPIIGIGIIGIGMIIGIKN